MAIKIIDECSIEDCKNIIKSSGLCNSHYIRNRKYGDPLKGGATIKRNTPKPYGTPCKVDKCEGVTSAGSAFGFCCAHYMRFKKGADLSTPIAKIRTKEKRINRDGYVVWADRASPYASNKENGTVLEHRHVMGEHLGRPLFKDENVHHKNGNRSDNKLSNLELWTKSQPSGQRVIDKIKWSIQFLEEYGYQIKAPKSKPA